MKLKFSCPKKENLSLPTDIREKKSLFSQYMWRKCDHHFFQFFTPICKWRWLQFVIASFISRSTVRRAAPVFFYTHWFSIICLELFLVIWSQQWVLLKNLSLRRFCFFLFYVQFHLHPRRSLMLALFPYFSVTVLSSSLPSSFCLSFFSLFYFLPFASQPFSLPQPLRWGPAFALCSITHLTKPAECLAFLSF